MDVKTAFKEYQVVVNADDEQVKEARRRRDLFKAAFTKEGDVTEVIASGSLRRGTQHDPIHDVDTIIVFTDDSHPEWGEPGDSAEDSLDYLGERVNDLLGATYGTEAQEVRLASPRDHAVKCFLDDPDAEEPFTVDAMPALRRNGMLLIPEVHSGKWIPANPEYLIQQTKIAHAAWNSFAPLVRVLKCWRHSVPTKVKSLVMEVLALQCMPREGERAQALSRFFTSAAMYAEDNDICDPAGVCGLIQPDLDIDTLVEHLSRAADLAADAVVAEENDDYPTAIALWGQILGEDFPESPDSGSDVGGDSGGDGGGSQNTGSGWSAGAAGTTAPAVLVPRPVRDAPQG